MTYEAFLSSILKETQKQAGDLFSVSIQKTVKNNGIVLDSLSIRKTDSSIAPAISLAPFYEEAEAGVSLDIIAGKILDLASRQNTLPAELNSWIYDFSQSKSHVAFRLISSQKNEALLSSVPHTLFLDLALIFYVIIEQKTGEQMTVLIHHEHEKLWHTDANELYHLACYNTPRLLPPKITPLNQLIASMSPELPLIPEDDAFPLHVLTNTAGLNGAACILYPQILKNFAELVKDDLYILPSSIHEVLLSPVSSSPSALELNQIVTEVNEFDVLPEDRLSDHVYFYSAQKEQITIPSCPSSVSASGGIWNPQ